MCMKTPNIREKVFEALGEASTLFMSKEERGVDMVMPTKELEKIGDDLLEWIDEYTG